jgi:hypothetical protein
MDESVFKELMLLLEKSGMTKTSAAKRLGITGPYFWNICAGKQKPGVELYGRMVALRDRLKRSGLSEAG